MITFSTESCCDISQDFYRTEVDKLPLKELKCSQCGSIGRLTRHAYYRRRVKRSGSHLTLTVSRLKCSECSHTHAVLPSCIVPYCQVTLGEQVEILCLFMRGLGASVVMERNPAIDENLSYSILRRYRMHWQGRIPAESILHTEPEEVSRICFCRFNRQFMQIWDTPNMLFANSGNAGIAASTTDGELAPA